MPAKSEAVRAAIVQAAQALFYEQGYTVTSVGAVAERAAVEKGHLTYYFASKGDLLLAVADAELAYFSGKVASWEARHLPPAAAIECFVAMMEEQAEMLAAFGCRMGTINSELGKTQPKLRVATQKLLHLFLWWLTRRFAEVLPDRLARDRAEQLLAMAEGAATLSHVQRDPEVIKRHGRLMRAWLYDVLPASERV